MTITCQKNRFSIDPDVRYLNCAYMSPLSLRVEEAGIAGIQKKRTPSRIVPDDFFSGPRRVRELFARLVNVPDPQDIAVIPSASYGLGIVLSNTVLNAGQNIVTVRHQFPSNMYPWRRLCQETGGLLRVVDPQGVVSGAAWNEAILDAIDDDTALVAVGQVHWTDGTRFDLRQIGARAREVGAAFVIDGTQSIGAMPFDVMDLEPDAVVCAAYKWLTGPYSIGAAYVGPRYRNGRPLEETWMAREGSEDFGGLVEYVDRYRAGAQRFDVGEASNFVLVPMLIAALEQLLEWEVRNIAKYCESLTGSAIERIRTHGYHVEEGTLRSPHLFGIRTPRGLDADQLKRRLYENQVSVSFRGEVIRVSPHVYNDEDDMDALVHALAR